MSAAELRLARRLARCAPRSPLHLIGGLQCLQADAVEARLAGLSDQGGDFCLVISTTFSDRLDLDGSNHHRTIRAADAWLADVKRLFPDARMLRGPEPETVIICTRPPKLAERLVIGHERRRHDILRGWARLQSRRRQKRRSPGSLSETELFALLAEKRVALVGNSRALSTTTHGAAIDAADIVIRCNRAPIVHIRSHGARTDWIATSAEIPEDLLPAKGATHVLWMSPRRDRMPLWLLDFPRLFVNPVEENRRLVAQTGARPSTGLMVIDLLLRASCRSVDLFGFDFFRSQSVSGSQTRAPRAA